MSSTTALEDAGAAMARLHEAVEWIRERSEVEPRVGVILGTGLGRLAEEIDTEASLSYEGIPHFPVSTVETHTGRLLLGSLGGTPVVAMEGRFHRYEGYDLKRVTFPVRVMGLLGAETLVVSSASSLAWCAAR